MDERDWLADRFEENRSHLRAVAYRMLGSVNEADDAVQESWLRLSRTDTSGVENLGGWLTTVVGRVCLDMLRSRTVRREEPYAEQPASVLATANGDVPDPEQDVLLADSVGLALQVVLDTLAPAERVAFVLHDLFAVPFDEVGPIVGRSPTAARQLASRARRRVQGAPTPEMDHTRQRRVVDAFLAASRGGDFEALLAVLDPDVVLRADGAAVLAGATSARGAAAVAESFAGRARAARPALLGGTVGLVWAPGGEPQVAFGFTISEGRIVAIELIADPERIRQLAVEILND